MPRCKIPRKVCFCPDVYYFKPRGIPMRQLKEVVLESDELEALKLYEIDELDQKAAAKKMKISQPTFARILGSAHKKVAKAIVQGYAINIQSSTDAPHCC